MKWAVVLRRLSGSTLWKRPLQGKPVESFPVPEGIVFVKVDHRTGVPTSGSGPGTIYECFSG